MKLTVINLDEHIKTLTDIEKNQVPFACSVAMNETVKTLAKKYLPQVIDRYVDKGANAYTKKGFYWWRSNKRDLVAYVGSKDDNEYLDTVIYGGIVKPLKDNRFLIQPVNVRLNKYGNLPRNSHQRRMDNPHLYFKGKPNKKAPYGVYRRYKRKKPKLVTLYDRKNRRQRGIFPAPTLARHFVRKQFIKNYNIAFGNIMMQGHRKPTGF